MAPQLVAICDHLKMARPLSLTQKDIWVENLSFCVKDAEPLVSKGKVFKILPCEKKVCEILPPDTSIIVERRQSKCLKKSP